MAEETGVVHVLWSGGWDSSFRVLDLVLHKRATVQPHYILALDRTRLRHELNAMRVMRNGVIDRDPLARSRLLPLKLVLLDDIAPNDSISSIWAAIRARQRISHQYEWLNRYAETQSSIGLELVFNRHDADKYGMWDHLVPALSADGSQSWRIEERTEVPLYVLFERFMFPIADLTKPQMVQLASERGYLDLLEHSWFCSMPIGDEPCGHCRTCRDTMKAGMSYRFSRMARIRYRFWKPFHTFYQLRDYPAVARERVFDRITGRRP